MRKTKEEEMQVTPLKLVNEGLLLTIKMPMFVSNLCGKFYLSS